VPERIVVVGLPGNEVPPADLYVGGARYVAGHQPAVVIGADVDAALGAIAAEPGVVCVLASGDPGFFGIGRALAARFGSERLDVRPAPSSVSVAFARIGQPWDDAVVVSAHGRPLSQAVAMAAGHPKVAVLVSPDSPPETLAKELLAAGVGDRRMVVCSRLGLPDESIADLDIEAVAAGSFDPLSVVIVLGDSASAKTLAWGRPDDTYAHRTGMITHAEVRAVALSKLELPATGVLWDVGAGSGSVAAECNALSPGLTVYAIERNADDCERIATNAPAARLVHGEAPGCLDDLPAPDRVFVGGGGLDVLDAVLTRLQPNGRVVATYAAMDRAAAAAQRLGALVQVAASRGRRLPDGGLRLAAENPVFIVWGPTA
jgi:precorrin-6B C5,15-methyltransferase / cobalt-precorrin-6B C5,C15-methyltransferase